MCLCMYSGPGRFDRVNDEWRPELCWILQNEQNKHNLWKVYREHGTAVLKLKRMPVLIWNFNMVMASFRTRMVNKYSTNFCPASEMGHHAVHCSLRVQLPRWGRHGCLVLSDPPIPMRPLGQMFFVLFLTLSEKGSSCCYVVKKCVHILMQMIFYNY